MSFNIALSGINAINTELDAISNNIANAGTYGFKSSRANFAAMYAGSQAMGTEASSLTQSIDIGGGVLTTGRSLDASLQGRGFFVTRDTSGAEVYTTRRHLLGRQRRLCFGQLRSSRAGLRRSR